MRTPSAPSAMRGFAAGRPVSPLPVPAELGDGRLDEVVHDVGQGVLSGVDAALAFGA